jgi:hypothetical protein
LTAGCHTKACSAAVSFVKPAPFLISTVPIGAFHIGTTGVPCLVKLEVFSFLEPTVISTSLTALKGFA